MKKPEIIIIAAATAASVVVTDRVIERVVIESRLKNEIENCQERWCKPLPPVLP